MYNQTCTIDPSRTNFPSLLRILALADFTNNTTLDSTMKPTRSLLVDHNPSPRMTTEPLFKLLLLLCQYSPN